MSGAQLAGHVRPVIGRWLVLLLLMAGLSAGGVALAPPASAHATVAATDPADGARLAAAPSRVSVTFDETVGLVLGYLRVIDADGQEVDQGAAGHPGGAGEVIGIDLRSRLGDNTYIISWRVISADGHPVEGSVRFVVGSGDLSGAAAPTGPVVAASTTVAFDIARSVSYAGLAVLGGGWLLLTVWPAGRAHRRSRRILTAGGVLCLLGAAAETLLQGAYAAGTGVGSVLHAGYLSDTMATTYGVMHGLRIVLLVPLLVLLRTLPVEGRTPVRRGILSGLLFLGVVFTFSQSGHAGVSTPRWLALTSDMAHLTAMSVWIGGLVLLVAGVLSRREPDEMRSVLPVFSRVALTSVVVIAATGTYQAWRESGTVRAITTTTYGRLVLLKVALLLGIILLAGVSRSMIQRHYLRRRSESSIDTGRMRRSVSAELVLAAVVLSVSGVLVAQAPGRAAVVVPAPAPVSGSAALGPGAVAGVTVLPGRHGIVTVMVTLTGQALPRRLVVTASDVALHIGPLPIPLTGPAVSGDLATFAATGVLLPAAGRWTFDFVVTASAFDAVTVTVPVVLG